ncbi:MAG TPA: aldehyde ferredoxin oxidoreductase C-terminal domain-containing protein [Candidatus Deferrimicrobiaceae bacterium]|jgi:aldehyde:ferredoxin oxidoreductase
MEPFLLQGLHVDLARMTASAEGLPEGESARWLGGRGLGVRFLLPHSTRAWDDPALPLVFAVGPLTAAGLAACGRTYVTSRSPLTGTLFTEDAGGDFGAQLRRCGLLYLRITGRSATPCRLTIDEGRATLEPDAWRPGSGDPAEGWDGRVASVGAAAMSGVRFASIVFDAPWAADRGGLGLVMASRNLLRIRVRGSVPPTVADPGGLAQAREQALRLIHAAPALCGPCGISRYGTATLFDLAASRRMLPTRNFRATAFEGAGALSATAFAHGTGAACDGCPVACGRVDPAGTPFPSFSALTHLGPLVGNGDPSTAVAANAFCREAGLDPVTAGATIAAFCEIRRGDLVEGELQALLRSIVARDGASDTLAEGSRRASERLGMPSASMAVKGLELPGFDPRGALGTALSYAVSTRGGDEAHAMAYVHEVLRKPVATDRFSLDGKARIVKTSEDLYAAADALGICRFAFFGASLEEYSGAFRSITGLASGQSALLEAGERIAAAERLFNEQSGFAFSDDVLPARFHDAPGTPGDGIFTPPIDRAAFSEALGHYAALRGIGVDGRLLPETIARLGLTEEARP